MNLSEMSMGVKAGIAAGIVVIIVALVVAFSALFGGPKREAAVHVPPPAGYPDIEPYNTKSWQDMQKKNASAGSIGPMPPPAMGGPPK